MSEIQDDDSDIPMLSGSALEALKEFYADRDAKEKELENLKAKKNTGDIITMDTFTENWNDSQFWYSQETADVFARELLAKCDNKSTIAVISAPSAFVQLKNIIVSSTAAVDPASTSMTADKIPEIYLLEFDERFSIFPEFVFYDYKYPLKLPPSMKGSIDHIICDPPFLSEDCQTKAALTARWLSKPSGVSQSLTTSDPASRVIVCTGERMNSLVNKLYGPLGVHTTDFEPVHAKGLSNEFYCYANFECSSWKWRD